MTVFLVGCTDPKCRCREFDARPSEFMRGAIVERPTVIPREPEWSPYVDGQAAVQRFYEVRR